MKYLFESADHTTRLHSASLRCRRRVPVAAVKHVAEEQRDVLDQLDHVLAQCGHRSHQIKI